MSAILLASVLAIQTAPALPKPAPVGHMESAPATSARRVAPSETTAHEARKNADDRQADAAELQNAIGSVEAVLILTTLVFTGLATTAAAQSAKAAEKTVSAMETTLLDIDRPLVYPRLLETSFRHQADDSLFPTGKFTWELVNHGRTPAVIISQRFRFAVERDGPPVPLNPHVEFDHDLDWHVPGGQIIGPDKTVEFHTTAFSKAPKLPHLDDLVYFYGYAEYESLLGVRYAVGYCFFLDTNVMSFIPRWPLGAEADWRSYVYDKRV